MKKIAMLLCMLAMVGSSSADVFWSWWPGAPADISDMDVRGSVLGIGSEVKSISGAQISICVSRAESVNAGLQYAIGYSRADTLRNGCQMAFVNSSDAAALQFGLLCFNSKGFLPFFVFFNFCSEQFGAGR